MGDCAAAVCCCCCCVLLLCCCCEDVAYRLEMIVRQQKQRAVDQSLPTRHIQVLRLRLIRCQSQSKENATGRADGDADKSCGRP